jgi:ABC-type Fe3+/spermidine/putrescine transport system ATPase subunit
VVVLHDGAIQQVGTPPEIYGRPANRFVAEFVGFENIVRATVLEERAGALAVSLEASGGRVWARGVAAGRIHRVGERVTIAVRAEDLGLVRGAGAPGTVRSRAALPRAAHMPASAGSTASSLPVAR